MTFLGDLVASTPDWAKTMCGVVGALYLSSKFVGFLRMLLSVFVLPGADLRKYGKKGTWAVITGASDGLGKEYASQLAAKGFNLVLVSRTLSKLEDVAKELKGRYNSLETKVLDMDFSADNDADYDRLAQLIAGLDVGILINNVGQSHSIPVPFLQTDRAEMQNIITINCMGTLKVTQVVAQGMKERRRGLILTMGSMGGWMPTPFLATYSGSKAFLQHWSSALASELKPSNVDVQLCLASMIVGAMSKIRRSNMMVPNAKPFVRAALGKIGLGANVQAVASTYTPWWAHALQLWVVENTVGASSPIAIKYSYNMHESIRTRALKKAAREAKKN